VNTVTVAVSNRTENLPAHVAQWNGGNNVTGLPSLGQSGNQVFTSHFYQAATYLEPLVERTSCGRLYRSKPSVSLLAKVVSNT
jgi:hypothetical protein